MKFFDFQTDCLQKNMYFHFPPSGGAICSIWHLTLVLPTYGTVLQDCCARSAKSVKFNLHHQGSYCVLNNPSLERSHQKPSLMRDVVIASIENRPLAVKMELKYVRLPILSSTKQTPSSSDPYNSRYFERK